MGAFLSSPLFILALLSRHYAPKATWSKPSSYWASYCKLVLSVEWLKEKLLFKFWTKWRRGGKWVFPVLPCPPEKVAAIFSATFYLTSLLLSYVMSVPPSLKCIWYVLCICPFHSSWIFTEDHIVALTDLWYNVRSWRVASGEDFCPFRTFLHGQVCSGVIYTSESYLKAGNLNV